MPTSAIMHTAVAISVNPDSPGPLLPLSATIPLFIEEVSAVGLYLVYGSRVLILLEIEVLGSRFALCSARREHLL